MRKIRRRWVSLCLFIAILGFESISADELCSLEIDSHLGQILDVRLMLDDNSEDLTEMRFRHALSSEYKSLGLSYTGLQQRILLEPVLSAVPAYIAISSIGLVNQKNFIILIEISKGQSSEFKQCSIQLAPPPTIEPKVPPKKVLSAPETLFRLLTLLGPERGLTHADAMLELQRLQAGDNMQAAEFRIIIALQEDSIDEEFIAGLRSVMTFEEEQLFLQELDRGKVAAVIVALFSVPGKPLLMRLLRAGLTEVSTVASDKTVPLEALQQQLSVLENQLAQAKSEMIGSGEILVAAESNNNVWQTWGRRWAFSSNFWWLLTLISVSALCVIIRHYIVHRKRDK